MSKLRAKHGSCSVVGCTDEHESLHRPPTALDKKAEWIRFIYNGNVPAAVGKNLYVCANHFVSESFCNLGQYNAGFANKLVLNERATPTIRGRTADQGEANTSGRLCVVRHVACQTDPPQRCTVGTQLSLRTLQPHFRSTGMQTKVSCADVGVGTSASKPFLISTRMARSCKRPRLELDEEDEEEEEENASEGSSYMNIPDPRGTRTIPDPQESVYNPEDSVTASAVVTPVHKMPTYIVYEKCLLELFEVCPLCQRVSGVRMRRFGTFLCVEQHCSHCQFFRKWNSQPILGSTPAGNLQLSAAVYATGASFFKLEKIFRAMRLKTFQCDTYRRLAKMYIEPAIVHKWKAAQGDLLEQLSQRQNVILGCDFRADSRGHSAKFGSYTMMDLKSNTVIDLQLVQNQSSDVGRSRHVDKDGLKRSLALLEACDVTPESIVTNRHPHIKKTLREANITHYYDVWHVEKGLSKKLEKMSQKKDCEKLKKWLRSIKNHMHWTAASSTSGPERVAKWTSILNHIRDVHTHEDPAFPQCLHPQRSSRDKSKWMTAGTPSFCRLEEVLTNQGVLKDVEKLSPHYQTSSLEAFHNVIQRFAPKNVVFPFLEMLCRHYLAALHFNENAGCPQAKTSAGESSMRECAAKSEKTAPTYHYVDELLDLIFEKVFPDPAPYVDEALKIPVPEDLSAQFDRPDKQEVTSSYVSRFSQRPLNSTYLP